MQIELRSTWRRLLFGLAVLLLATLYVASALRMYIAHREANSATLSGLQKAVRLAPSNAGYHNLLGRYLFFIVQDSGSALREYQEAVRLNPHMARYWLDMANVHQFNGDIGQERNAVEHAIQVEPTRPDIAWEAANFYLVQDDLDRALQLFRIVIQNDPNSISQAVELCWRATGNPELILNKVLPSTTEPHVAFLNFLRLRNESEGAAAVWSRLVSLNQPFEASAALYYTDYLMKMGKVRDSSAAWQQFLRVNPSFNRYSQPGNLIVNGGFDLDLLNGGFDWRFDPVTGVKLELDTSRFHDGTRSMMVSFTGDPTAATGLYQLVPVEPNTSYEFNAEVKAEDILSASGPRIQITDFFTGSGYVLTEDVLGSTVWRHMMVNFKTGPGTELVKLSVVRAPSSQHITGKLWLDDLNLVRK